MWSLLLSVGAILASIGLQRAIDKFDELKAKKNGVSADDILSLVRTSVAEARAKGDKTVMALSDKLNGLDFPIGMSSSIKGYISGVVRKAREAYNVARDANQLKQYVYDVIENRASNLANQPASYRSSDSGKSELTDIVNQYNKVAEGVEKIVNPLSQKQPQQGHGGGGGKGL